MRVGAYDFYLRVMKCHTPSLVITFSGAINPTTTVPAPMLIFRAFLLREDLYREWLAPNKDCAPNNVLVYASSLKLPRVSSRHASAWILLAGLPRSESSKVELFYCVGCRGWSRNIVRGFSWPVVTGCGNPKIVSILEHCHIRPRSITSSEVAKYPWISQFVKLSLQWA